MSAIFFRSWLPTVSGRLSFSSFGHSIYPRATRYTNRASGDERFLICFQRRIGIDAALPFASAFANALWDRDGDFIYVTLCKAVPHEDRPQEALVGDVFILQRKVVGSEAQQVVDALRKLLARYKEAEFAGKLSKYIEHEWDRCCRDLDRMCAFRVAMEVCRSGKTTIEIDDATLVRTDWPSLGDTPQDREKFAHRLAAQIFYFLRDIGHHHQHHDPATDTIVDLFPFDGRDDFSWREQVLYNIYRTIIQYKRNPKNKQFHECVGLLAYASTFQAISRQELNDKDSQRLPYFNDAGLERSLSSLQSVNQLAHDQTTRRNAVIQNIILWVVGFVISVIGLLQVTDTKIEEPSAMLQFFGRIAVQSTEVLAGLVGCAILVTVMFHSDAWMNPKKWRLIIGAARIVAAWPKPLSGGAFIVVGLIILAVCAVLLHFA